MFTSQNVFKSAKWNFLTAKSQNEVFLAGTRLASIGGYCKNSSTTANDGLDNDCDGLIDEELNNGLDDDGDGLIGLSSLYSL